MRSPWMLVPVPKQRGAYCDRRRTFDLLLPSPLSVTELFAPLGILDTQTECTEVGDRSRITITFHGTGRKTDRIRPLDLQITISLAGLTIFDSALSEILLDGQSTVSRSTTVGIWSTGIKKDRSTFAASQCRSIGRFGSCSDRPTQFYILEVRFCIVRSFGIRHDDI